MSIIEGTVDLTKDLDRPVDAVFGAWSREEAQRAWSDPGEGWELSFDQFQSPSEKRTSAASGQLAVSNISTRTATSKSNPGSGLCI